jgi:hypothetical protein
MKEIPSPSVFLLGGRICIHLAFDSDMCVEN